MITKEHMNRPLCEWTEPELVQLMTNIARSTEARLPVGPSRKGKALFVLLVFDEPRVAQYVSNAERSGIIEAMRETADCLERNEDVAR